MISFQSPLASVNPAVYGLVGSLIGGFIAGTVSLLVARQARDAAERAWVRDNRREIYDRFLTNAQTLLIEILRAHRHEQSEDVETAYVGFFATYGVVQTVAARSVVDAARTYAYRLMELKEELRSANPSEPEYFGNVAAQIRFARHDTIDAMRGELGLDGSARPPKPYNPFAGTTLADAYTAAQVRRASEDRGRESDPLIT